MAIAATTITEMTLSNSKKFFGIGIHIICRQIDGEDGQPDKIEYVVGYIKESFTDAAI